MYTVVASYQEPLEIPEERLIDKQNTATVWKQNILTNTTNQQQIAVTPVTHKNDTLLAKWGTPLCSYAHECLKSSKVFINNEQYVTTTTCDFWRTPEARLELEEIKI